MRRAFLSLVFSIGMLALWSATALARGIDDDVTLAEDIERRMVAVRIIDASMADVIAYGSGLIVGEREGQWLIATARHVIAPADFKREDFHIEVRFFRRDEWIRLTEPVIASGARDLAVLAAPIKWSPFEAGTLESMLPVAALNENSARASLSLFGVDVDRQREVRRTAGVIDRLDGDRVVFASPDVKPGWSGGVAFNEIGLTGMIVSEGSAGQGHQAIAWTAIYDELRVLGLPLHVRSEPLMQALANVQRNNMAIAVFSWDVSSGTKVVGEWGAMRLTAQEGLRFTGDHISVRGGGAACAIEPRGSEVIVTVPSRLLWRTNDRDPPPTWVFSPTDDCAVRGMIVLKCINGDATAYIAIPTRRCELLGATVIRQAAGNQWQRLALDQSLMQGFTLQAQPNDVLLDGKRPAFPLTYPRPNTTWTFSLEHPATLRTQIRVGEGALKLQERDRARIDSQRVVLRDAEKQTELGRKRVRSEGERTSNWAIDTPPRFTMVFEGEQRASETPIVFEAATLEYQP